MIDFNIECDGSFYTKSFLTGTSYIISNKKGAFYATGCVACDGASIKEYESMAFLDALKRAKYEWCSMGR